MYICAGTDWSLFDYIGLSFLFSIYLLLCLSFLLFSHQLMFIYSLSQVYVSFVSFSHRVIPLSFYCSVGLVLVCSIRFGLSEKIIILD